MPATAPETTPRIFTLRALLIGLAGGLFVAAFSYYNDYGIGQNLFVGNHLPLTIYSAFFLFLVLVNPLLRRFSDRPIFVLFVSALLWLGAGEMSHLLHRWLPLIAFGFVYFLVVIASRALHINPLRAFSRGELVVILSAVLVACSLPTSGLMRNLPQMLVMPQHYGAAMPDWQKAEPDRYVTEVNHNVFPQHDEEGKVYDGYAQGIAKGKDLAPLRDTPVDVWLVKGAKDILELLKAIPLWAWSGPAKVWFPLLIVGFIFIISMCCIVHRQWSENEQLSYPIAEFAHSLLKSDHGRTTSDIFYNRPFWIAFGCVLFVHLVNGWNMYDERMIKIPLGWNLSGIWWNKFTFFHHAGGHTYFLYANRIYLTIVAFAYFLPEEISLSLGLSLPLMAIFTATAYQLGRPINGDEQNFMVFGSYVAMAAVICYTGRYYYAAIFKRAFFVKAPGSEVDGDPAVAACRWFIAATILFILLLMGMGLDWLLATMMVFIVGVMFLVLARASAETGIPFMGTPFFARNIIMALLGPAAIGPANIYLLELVTVATMQDNRECLAPYVINNLRLGSRNEVAPAPLSRTMMMVLVPALFVAGLSFLWVIYGRGAANDGHMGHWVPSSFASEISRTIQKLKRNDKLEISKTVTGLERFSGEVRDTNPSLFTFFVVGIGLVALNAMLRLRYVWWPLHPVAFLFWNVWATNNFVWSFLLGWLVKVLVVKIGGGRTYQDLKPVFIGLIIGDLVGGVFWILFGLGWYFITGHQPRNYMVFPF
jgi:hypothetical protein